MQLSLDILPPQVTHLCLHPKFNSLLPPLPHSLTHLSFGCLFNQPVDNLPPNLTHLEFSFYFNNPVEHLPNGLTHLTFGFYFNRPVDNLPSSLLQLHFGSIIRTDDKLPPSQRKRSSQELRSVFNQSLERLPSSITSLNIPEQFYRTIHKLPHSLRSLKIHNSSRIRIHRDTNLAIPAWPPALQQLELSDFLDLGFENIPDALQILKIKCHRYEEYRTPTHLPLSVTDLALYRAPPSSTDWNSFTSLKSLIVFGDTRQDTNFPATLSNVTISSYRSLSINPLPHTITQLTLNARLNVRLNKFLPPNLTYLYINSDFNKPLHHLPPSLLELEIGPYLDQCLLPNLTYFDFHSHDFNQPLDRLPASLLQLTVFSSAFNQALDSLPPFLTHLSLSDPYNEPLNHLPNSLTSLSLGRHYSQPLLHLPPALCVLKVDVRKVKTVLPPFVSVITQLGACSCSKCMSRHHIQI